MTDDTSPSQRRKDKTRQDIIEATHALLITQGVEGSSIRRIAEKIDYSPTALYHYFGNKEDLLDAVRAYCFERLNARIFQRILTATDVAEQLLIGGLTYLEYAHENPVDYHLMFYLAPSQATQHNHHQTAMSALLHIVRSGIEAGVFITDNGYDENAIVYHCWATVHGLAMLYTTVMSDEQALLRSLSVSILKKVIAGFTRHSHE